MCVCVSSSPPRCPAPSLPAPRAELLQTLPQTFPSSLVPRVPSPLYLLAGAFRNAAVQFPHPINPGSAAGINERRASLASLILLSRFERPPQHPLPPNTSSWTVRLSVPPSWVLAAAAGTPPPGSHPQHPGGGFARRVGAPIGAGSLFWGAEVWGGRRRRRRASGRRAGRMERWMEGRWRRQTGVPGGVVTCDKRPTSR